MSGVTPPTGARVIHKQSLEIAPYMTIELPIGAEVFAVGEQGEDRRLSFWYHTPLDSAPAVTHCFMALATGAEFDAEMLGDHLDTVILPGGFVVHVFRSAVKCNG